MLQLTMWKGRDAQKKAELIENLTRVTSEVLAIPTEHVRVILYEVGREDWGVGGVPASEREWGY